MINSHVSSRPNWYWKHAVCNLRFFSFFSKNCYYFSDLETLWPWNFELKDFAFHLSVIRGGMLQYWRIFYFCFTKKYQLCFKLRLSNMFASQIFCIFDPHLITKVQWLQHDAVFNNIDLLKGKTWFLFPSSELYFCSNLVRYRPSFFFIISQLLKDLHLNIEKWAGRRKVQSPFGTN